MNNKRRIRGLRQRALVVAGKADQINLLPLQALIQLSAELLRPDLEMIQMESKQAAFFCSRIS